MAVLFKNPDNIVKKINVLNPATNDSNNIESSGSFQPSVDRIPLVFGRQRVTPVPIYTIDGPETQYNAPVGTRTKIIFYAISANTSAFTTSQSQNSSRIQTVYIDGKRVEGLVTISPTTNKPISGVDWKYGSNYSSPVTDGALGGALNSGISGNFGGNQIPYGSNIYAGFIRAGSDFTQHAFYKHFTGQTAGLPYLDLIKDYPDNQHFDMLAIYYKFHSSYFSNDNPKIELVYERNPSGRTGTQGYGLRTNRDVGNCIMEILANPNWGMGLVADEDFEQADFYNRGGSMAGVFYIDEKPLIENIKIINEEQTDNQIYEEAGKLRYGPTNLTGSAITDDNIIGDIEIQYPDNAVVPTKLIATYTSYSFGTREIEIGTDDTNVVRTEIRTTNNATNAKIIAKKMFESLNDTITLSFKADRSLHQFSVRDQLTLSTEVFSGTITIVEMTMNADYTFDVVAEGSAGNSIPEANLRGKTPVIQIGDGYYRPPDVEPNPEIEDPIEEPIVPGPIPPQELLLAIDGLNHPYNHITGSDNTSWYLGGTQDGITADTNYDANGCRTRFYGAGGGAVLSTDFSLIYRNQNGEKPTAIECVIDVAIGTEQNNKLVGFNKGSYRFDYPKFFNNITDNVRFNNGTGWYIWTNKSWPNVYNQRPVYRGGEDPVYDQTNTFDYQYQTETFGFPDRQRKPHMILSNNIYRPRNLDFFWATSNMQRSGAYRLHFTAIYGPVSSPNHVEYIGSTTTYGDFRSIQAQDISEARSTAQFFAQDFTPVTATPPSRAIG